MAFSRAREYALQLDAADRLASFKDRFYVPEGQLYFDGNSLGLLSKDAEASVQHALHEWATLGIGGWLAGDPPWFEFGERLGGLLAGFVGAASDEVVVAGSTTVNLHTLALSFLKAQPRGKNILADRLNFPSDLYALAADADLMGGTLKLVDSDDGRFLDEDAIIAAMTPDIGLAVIPSVLYRSGQLLDMPRLARAARERGVILGFDCCHSAGVVPHEFAEWDVDFAFWCTYKYLNAGPGATAALYVNRRHWGLLPALPGWWGHKKDTQFDMRTQYEKAPGVGAWQIGTPSVLGSAAVLGSARLTALAGMENIRAKSLAQTDYLIALIDEVLAPLGFSAGTPREGRRRGGHVALEHAESWRIYVAMKDRGVIPDFRPPNVVRLAPVPLYTSYEDIWRAVDIIRDIVENGQHLLVPPGRVAVT